MLMIPMAMTSLVWRASTSSVPELESTLAAYELLVWISGALVLLGVLGEVVADRRKFKDERTKHSLKKWGERTLLVGLAGEIAFGIATSILSGTVIAKLDLETAKANERTVKLQTLLGPRFILEEQQRIIKDRLSKLPRTSVDIFVFDGDEWTRFESILFARQLASVLDDAGTDTRGYWGTGCGMTQQPLLGVNVIAGPKATAQEQLEAKALKEAFQDGDIDLTYFPRSMPICQLFSDLLPDPQKPARGHWTNIAIMIGYKPAPMLARPTVKDLIRPVLPLRK
jgi:hypothetical protein